MSLNIPTIDFGPFRSGSPADRQQTASDIDAAFSTVGFCRLHNHGIKQERIDQCFEWSTRFFQLADSYKQTLSPKAQSLEHGYYGIGAETIRGKKGMKENFDFGNPKDASLGFWPNEEQLPGFREFAEEFHQDCYKLIHELLKGISSALNLNLDNSLCQYHTGSSFACSLLHYPHEPFDQTDPGVRYAAHSDLSTLTLLFQQNVGGLEIADMNSTDKTSSADIDKEAQFIYVEPEPGILVLPGYFLDRWTSGKYQGAVHRVSASSRSISDSMIQESKGLEMMPERYSIAYFGVPDAATTIKPLSTCLGEQKTTRGPLNVGKFLLKKKGVLYE